MIIYIINYLLYILNIHLLIKFNINISERYESIK